MNNNIKEPYMDEEFHYRQFSTYAGGDFKTWDPKITTPPGLYYVQYFLSQLFGADLSTMRTINSLIFSNIFLIFIVKIY
jgi:alpha-1,2-glucosyltransferase